MREIDQKFNQLPKEYFAQKFTNPSFPPMDPGVSWGMLLANMLFYIFNFVQCIDAEAYVQCIDGEVTVMKYSSIGVMTIAALMFVARIYWGKKAINKHKIGFIHYTAWMFGEFRLLLLSAMTMWAASLMSDGVVSDQETISIVNAVYIGAAVLLVADIVLNIVFWELLKRKIIEGAFKENGKGFFGEIKNKGKTVFIFERVGRVVMTLCLAFIPLSRVIDIRWDTSWNPLLAVLLITLMLVLSVTFAYADALLLGRAHYVKKFELETQENESPSN